jgi:hypothetical protein
LLIDVVCYTVILIPAAAIASGAGIFGAFSRSARDPRLAWLSLVGVHLLTAIIYAWVFLHGRWKRKEIEGLS